jgi:hypothetical protein
VEVARLVSEHLVSPSGSQEFAQSGVESGVMDPNAASPRSLGSVSHSLLGGEFVLMIPLYLINKLGGACCLS